MVDTTKVNTTDTTVAKTVAVPPGKMAAVISRPRRSTISWVAGLGTAFLAYNTVAPMIGLPSITPEQQAQATTHAVQVVGGIGAIMGAYVWVKRTYFHG